MTIFVCYFDYSENEEDFDRCSHPVTFFTKAEAAIEWCERNRGTYQTMISGREYLGR